MKQKRDYNKEMVALMKEQLDAFERMAPEHERVAIFIKIQKLQKERAKVERKDD